MRKFIFLVFGNILFSIYVVAAPTYFDLVFTIDSTRVGGGNPSPSFPIHAVEGETYYYSVECDDKHPGINETNANGLTGSHYCEYDTEDIYTIRITGTYPRILLYRSIYAPSILSIEQWGTTNWTSMENAFRGATNLVINATDNPELTDTTSMQGMFQDAISVNQDIGDWDVSNVSNFRSIFKGATSFNQDISDWNISGVINAENMNDMFADINLSISNYDNLLLSWWKLDPVDNVAFAVGSSDYCRGVEARDDLILRDSWTFTDGDENCEFHITSSCTMSVQDGETVVGNVTISFSDDDTFFILGNGTDRDKFYINSITGELSFINPPDVNNPTDKNKDNVYRVQVAAKDDTNDRIDIQTIRVTVTPDLNTALVPTIMYLLN